VSPYPDEDLLQNNEKNEETNDPTQDLDEVLE
jgi:hypothetical protein